MREPDEPPNPPLDSVTSFTITLVHADPLSASRSTTGDRQLVDQGSYLTFESACTLHSPITMYYYSIMGYILIYRPSEGGRLSRPSPKRCSKCAARAQTCLSQ